MGKYLRQLPTYVCASTRHLQDGTIFYLKRADIPEIDNAMHDWYKLCVCHVEIHSPDSCFGHTFTNGKLGKVLRIFLVKS